MTGDAALLAAIESVADGRPVDWATLEAAAEDPHTRDLLRELRLVESLADVHRTLREEELPAPDFAGAGRVLLFPAAPREPALTPGRHWGHLEIRERIGGGAFGDVYRARDTQLQRDVALKILHRHVASTPALEGRLLDEARALARVRHGHVVIVHGADRRDDRVGLWMELVEGQTLERWLATQGPCSGREAALIGQQVAGAVAAVHAAGLVHRDIKAQNVVRERGGRLVLMDFGAGRAQGESDAARLAGTPLCLAPEVLAGGPATVASDVYSLGILLYHLVTGGYPVTGASLDDLRAAHQAGEARRLRDVRPGLPEAFVRVVDRALDPDPSRRYPTAGALQDALVRVHDEEGVRTRRERLWRNVGWLVAATAVVALGLLAVFAGRFGRPAGDVQSIAILPLRDVSGGQEYFANGMTEALTTELAGLKGLRVISHTSAMQFKGGGKSLPEVAALLGVDGVIEGAVQRSDDRVRVTLRLIHAGTETTVWARAFERNVRDVLLLQSDVARAVAAQVRVAVASDDRPGPSRSIDPEAHDAYLRARFEFNSDSLDAMERAVASYQRAIELSPEFAPAWAGLSQCYLRLVGVHRTIPRAEGLELTRRAALRAIEIDGGVAEAYVTLGQLAFMFDWDDTAAEEAFRKALELNPGSTLALVQHANLFAARGDVDSALREIAEARAADPLSLDVQGWEGIFLYYARRYPEARAIFERITTLQPRQLSGHIGLARVLVAERRFDAALAAVARAEAIVGETPVNISVAGQACAGLDRVSDAEAAVRRLASRPQADPVMGTEDHIAYIYAALGRRDEALANLERAVDLRLNSIRWLAVDPRVDPLRGEPRFRALLVKLGVTSAE
jgi:TolB-like protein/Flp pilus assembly protein TadD